MPDHWLTAAPSARSGAVVYQPSDLAAAGYAARLRATRLRQARLLALAPLWYVAPLLGPMAVLPRIGAAGGAAEVFARLAPSLLIAGSAVSALNLWAAWRLWRESGGAA